MESFFAASCDIASTRHVFDNDAFSMFHLNGLEAVVTRVFTSIALRICKHIAVDAPHARRTSTDSNTMEMRVARLTGLETRY